MGILTSIIQASLFGWGELILDVQTHHFVLIKSHHQFSLECMCLVHSVQNRSQLFSAAVLAEVKKKKKARACEISVHIPLAI